MGVDAKRTVGDLASGFVLAPERYDPRRVIEVSSTVCIADLATLSTVPWTPGGPRRSVLVLDTSHAFEGFVRLRHAPGLAADVGSAKRDLKPGDLIVSRLRPYLRQVAWVDGALFEREPAGNAVACSTEFHVLRPKDGSLAFLLPWLLSAPVQAVLAAAQEGGHHPRVGRDVLLGLPVPERLMRGRLELGSEVEARVAAMRTASDGLARLAREDWLR